VFKLVENSSVTQGFTKVKPVNEDGSAIVWSNQT
jgi:hypothetical protein